MVLKTKTKNNKKTNPNDFQKSVHQKTLHNSQNKEHNVLNKNITKTQ